MGRPLVTALRMPPRHRSRSRSRMRLGSHMRFRRNRRLGRNRARQHARATTLVARLASPIPGTSMRTAATALDTPHHARTQNSTRWRRRRRWWWWWRRMRGPGRHVGRRHRRHRNQHGGNRHRNANKQFLHWLIPSLFFWEFSRTSQAWPANFFRVVSAIVRFFSRSCLSPQPHSHETPPV